MGLFSRKKPISIKVSVFIENDGGVFYAHAPSLPGLHVEGETREEVEAAVGDAVTAYLLSLMKRNDPLPIGSIVPVMPNADTYTVTQSLPALA